MYCILKEINKYWKTFKYLLIGVCVSSALQIWAVCTIILYTLFRPRRTKMHSWCNYVKDGIIFSDKLSIGDASWEGDNLVERTSLHDFIFIGVQLPQSWSPRICRQHVKWQYVKSKYCHIRHFTMHGQNKKPLSRGPITTTLCSLICRLKGFNYSHFTRVFLLQTMYCVNNQLIISYIIANCWCIQSNLIINSATNCQKLRTIPIKNISRIVNLFCHRCRFSKWKLWQGRTSIISWIQIYQQFLNNLN